MSTLIRMLCVCCALAFGALMLSPSAAYATPSDTIDIDMINQCELYQGLVNRFGSCIRQVINNVAQDYFTNMYSYFVGAMNVFLTLGVVLYGVMIIAGLIENIKRDMVILLVKIAFVIYFAQNLNWIYDNVVDIMDGLIEMYFDFSSSMDEGLCRIIGTGFGPFQRLDCLMDLVIGLNTSGYGGSYSEKVSGDGLGRGLINFFFKAGLSSSIGIVVSAIGFAMVYTLIFTVIRIVFMYLMSLIALTFIIMLGPIFLPLVIFKVTKQYFDKLLNLVVSFGLQPVIMFAYVALMIIAFDKAIFSGSNSLVSAIAGPASQVPGFNLNKWLVDNGIVEKDGLAGWEAKADDPMKSTENLEAGEPGSVTQAGIRRDESAGEDTTVKTYSQNIPISMINWEKLAEVRGMEENELHDEVMLASVFMGLVAYVFISMMQHIPAIGTDLTGGIYDSPNLWGTVGQNPLGDVSGKVGGSLQQGLQRMMSKGGG